MPDSRPPFQLEGYIVKHSYSQLGFIEVIDDVISGDDYYTERVFTMPVDLLDLQDYPVKIYFTVKTDPRDADANAVISLSINNTDTGNGYIKTSFAVNWIPMVDFTLKLTGLQTAKFTPEQRYFYDIKYITNLGKAKTYERGMLYAQQGVTRATT